MKLEDELITWIDVETTGVDADTDALLEVACLITDFHLNIVEPSGFRAIIQYSVDEVEELKKSTTPYVINMHTKTGLWDSLPDGTPLGEVDVQLRDYIASLVAEPNTSRLGGNSITLDRNFINKYLPMSGGYLHYRSVDVTSIAGLAQHWYNGLQYQKKTLHSAMDDIMESIEELRFLRGAAFK
jgi:oligoribonuclease